MRLRSLAMALFALLVLATASTVFAQPLAPASVTPLGTPLVRFAQFNASLNRGAAGQLISALESGSDPQIKTVAEIIQRINPDVLLINEFDYEPDNRAANLFRANYLGVSQNGATPISFPYVYVAPSNTGIASGFDLNNNGTIVTTPGAPGYGDDAFGFGLFPGQFGMALFSKYPIDFDAVRTFQRFRWRDMPGARLPDDPATPAPADWYSPAELEVFRLSSKSHWDVPILIGDSVVHVLASHPTPPVFDGPEDRNGLRNADEIRFWADYITPGAGRYIYDDRGRRGGLAPNARFVVMGDQNSDPEDGDSVPGAIQQLLDNPLVNTTITPSSLGGPQQAELQGGANATHEGDPAFDTADFADGTPGNLRADYVLPSINLLMRDAQVFWPLNSDPLFPLVGLFTPGVPGGFPASDHRAVYVDVSVAPSVLPSRETRAVIDDEELAAETGRRLGDADDPAIWIEPKRPARSLVIGVLKDGGLDVYDLGGRVLQSITSEPGKEELRYNNVDLVYNVQGADSGPFDLAAITDRRNDLMVFYKVNAFRRKLELITLPGLPRVFTEGDDAALEEQTTAYGIALAHAGGDLYAFVSKRSSNEVAQLRLLVEPSGLVGWERVHTFSFPLVDDDPEESQVEGMVVDQELGIVYMGQEGYGIWRAPVADAEGTTVCPSDECTLVDGVFPRGPNLKADVEGLTIYHAGGGAGYLLASSQGDNSFAVYDRQSNAYLGSFVVGPKRRTDGAQESDGAEVVSANLGPAFPHGLLVVQDGRNDPAVLLEDEGELENVNTNFKFVRWESVARAFPMPLLIDTTGYDPRAER